MASQGHFDLLHSRGFILTMVHVDPQSAFCNLTTQFPEVVIDIGGAGDFDAKLHAKIRRIKEFYCSVKSGLLWKLPSILVKDLVAFAVACINILQSKGNKPTGSPKVLFTGMRVQQGTLPGFWGLL
jgi:hypothetical protein